MEALPIVEYQQNSDYEVNSQNENVEYSVLDEDDGNQDSNRKRRHTPDQVQVMEAFFKDCPNPNEKERKSLSQALGLEPLQVKFWFQNKRTQLKTQQKRSENSILKDHNEKLRLENKKLKEAASKIGCMRCGKSTVLEGMLSAPLEQLKHENARLKNELENLHNLAKNYMEKTAWNDPQFSAPLVAPRSLDLGVGSSSYGGQQLIMNSGEQINYAANRQFNNVPHSVPPYDEQRMYQQTMGGTFWTPAIINEYIKTKKPRNNNPLMD